MTELSSSFRLVNMGLCSTETASPAVSHRKGTLTRFLGWFSEQGLDPVTIENASPKPHHLRCVIPGSEHDSEALCSQATSAATLHTEQVTPTSSGHSGFHDHAMSFLQGLLHMWAFWLEHSLRLPLCPTQASAHKLLLQ